MCLYFFMNLLKREGVNVLDKDSINFLIYHSLMCFDLNILCVFFELAPASWLTGQVTQKYILTFILKIIFIINYL